MPELPEVQTVVDSLRPALLGRRITTVQLKRLDIITPPGFNLPQALTGRHATAITRRGKRIVIELDDKNRLFIHLGMSGRLTLQSPAAPTAKHTHLILEFHPQPRTPALQLHFSDPRRFGGIWWLGTNHPDKDLGPEPLTLRAPDLAQRLKRTTRAIKNALLDQRVIAGLGNIYVDESLFAARIHPLAKANKLTQDQIARLSTAIKRTLRRAILHRGSTLRDYVDGNNAPGNFQLRHNVYGREHAPCPRCKTKIKRIVLGGRSTHFCPNCQKR